jgi:putative oxidoreductase
MKITVLILRSLLALIYLVFGLNFFFHFSFIPMPAPPAGPAGAFEGGLFGAGYFFPFMKVIEIVSGFFLLINKYTALFVLIIFPITLNIFLFHAFLAKEGIPMGGIMILINLFLGYAYRKYYVSLFTASPTV